ncbi:crystallin J1A [Biomphalaria glabrata]|nr:crystallin J1A [Biomphalaria glabrata]
MADLEQRKIAAIVGACVADAAAQPLHWVYNDDVMQSVTQDREDVEFWVPSANPYYKIEGGRNTCYGDQAYVMLKSLVDSESFNLENLTKANYDFFGPESEYEKPESDIQESYPVNRPWRHGCLRDFIKNIHDKVTPPGSPEDDQIDCAVRIIPLVAMYAGHPQMLEVVEKGLRVLQESDLAATIGLAAARILEQYILLGDPGDVLTTVSNKLSDAHREYPQELDKAVAGQIHQVERVRNEPHAVAVNKYFKKS